MTPPRSHTSPAKGRHRLLAVVGGPLPIWWNLAVECLTLWFQRWKPLLKWQWWTTSNTMPFSLKQKSFRMFPFKSVSLTRINSTCENTLLAFQSQLRCSINIPAAYNNMFCHHQRVLIDSGDSVVAHKKISSPEASELTESLHVLGCNRSVLAEISSIVGFLFSRCEIFFYVALSQVYACCI